MRFWRATAWLVAWLIALSRLRNHSAEKAVGAADVQYVITPKDEDSEFNRETARIDRKRLKIEARTFAVVSLGTVVAACSLLFLYQSTNAARDAARAALKSSEAAQALNRMTAEVVDRPWLKVEVTARGPFTFSEKEARLTAQFEIANVGRSIALNVELRVKVLIPIGDKDPFKEQRRLCDEPDSVAPGVEGGGHSPTLYFPATRFDGSALSPCPGRRLKRCGIRLMD